MKTLTEIRNDLKEIRYYYMQKKAIDYSFGFTGQAENMKTVNLYNEQIKHASFVLYDVYTSLYIDNQTQNSLAQKFGCSTEYVQRLHKKLLIYLQENLKDKENV